MKMSYVAVGVVIIIVVVAVAALSLKSSGPSPPPTTENIENIVTNFQAGGSLTINHWWTINVEEQGFNVAKDGFGNQYPNATINAVPVPGGSGGAMPPLILPQLQAGNAPESFQSHPGYEVATYTGYLRSLNDLWAFDNLEQRTPKIIRDLSKTGSDYFIAPIGVHRTNVVWYNKQLFQDAGVTPPSGPITFDQFWALCDELENKLPSGTSVLDLGDGMTSPWASTEVFETIMAGLDLKTYQDFINGVVTESQLIPVLDNFKKFLSYVPSNHLTRDWPAACGQLFINNTAMFLHGDWVKGYFKSRTWQYGVQYGSFPAPGPSGEFGVVVDGFVVPKDAGNIGNGLRWINSYTTEAVQSAFNPVKGSVSPYNDVPLTIYDDDYSKEAAQSLQNASTKFYPSITHGTAIPNGVLFGLHPNISEFVHNQDVEASAREIVDTVKSGTYTIQWNITS
jgi:glucose/mannose transport system substrate-binding protein